NSIKYTQNKTPTSSHQAYLMAKNENNHHHHHEQADDHKMDHSEHVGNGYHEAQVKEGMHDHNNPSQDHNQHDDSDHSGHDHEHHHHGNFKEIFLKSLSLGIVILLLSPMMDVRLPFQFTFPYSDIAVAILA